MKGSGLKIGAAGVRRFVFVGCVGVGLTAMPGSAFAQAAASYGAVAGSSAATTAKAGSSLNRSTNKLAGRIAGSLSKSASKTSVRSVTKPLEVIMEENRQKLEEESKEGGATLHIESSPAKATVLIDGEPVAKTPADLKLPKGDHIVELKEFESQDWKKEITLAPDENLTLKPELKKRYQSAITISFD
jgi:hypothetical protein